MAPRCSVCTHPDRAKIDSMLARDAASLRDMAGQFGLTKTSLHRHRTEHLPVRLAKAVERQATRDGLDVLAQLQAINEAALAVLREARAAGNGELVLKAADRVLRQLELQAKLLGELSDGNTVNIIVSPQWLELRAVIVGALSAHPEARQSVAAALQGWEADLA